MFTRDGLGWTERDKTLLLEYAGKVSCKEIARALNRSPEAVQSKASKLGVSLICMACVKCGAPRKRVGTRYRCRACDTKYERERLRKK